ncbi:MAG TPA: T9SS type A sorting domain-containing protein, partial [Bacteroidia bacterium]|nr:T9SS type A sorting domain-containing protein [Bacteroidia bacterium]
CALKAQAVTGPNICMATVDDSSKHNIIYYDKTQVAAADSFILYRESNTVPGNYTKVMSNDSAAFSMFLDMDTAGNPNIKLHRYKLGTWHHVSGYSQMGPYHTILYCLQNVTNYAWNYYDIEGTGSGMVSKYFLLRDDNSLNAWHPIDSVAGSANSTIDPNVLSYPNGRWRLVTKWSISCSPTAKYGNNSTQTTIIKSKSNITNNRTSGINSLKEADLILYPNPATGQVTLRTNFPVNENASVRIYNALGMEMLSSVLSFGKDELIIPVNGLQKGIYFAEISNSKGRIVKRLAIE